jgi:RimJ/RimL family protein N-acetyltransferase
MHVQLIPIDKQGRPQDVSGRLDMYVKQICKATAELYKRSGFAKPWIGYLAVHDRELVGACAFKSAPNKNGASATVEIGYLTFPKFEGQGIATEMVRELLQIARATDVGLTILAQTDDIDNASATVLKKSGFQCTGEQDDADGDRMWQWQLSLSNSAKPV